MLGRLGVRRAGVPLGEGLLELRTELRRVGEQADHAGQPSHSNGIHSAVGACQYESDHCHYSFSHQTSLSEWPKVL